MKETVSLEVWRLSISKFYQVNFQRLFVRQTVSAKSKAEGLKRLFESVTARTSLRTLECFSKLVPIFGELWIKLKYIGRYNGYIEPFLQPPKRSSYSARANAHCRAECLTETDATYRTHSKLWLRVRNYFLAFFLSLSLSLSLVSRAHYPRYRCAKRKRTKFMSKGIRSKYSSF